MLKSCCHYLCHLSKQSNYNNFIPTVLLHSNPSFNFDLRKMSGDSSKKIKKALKIGTHDGLFHCDEVLACFMLKQLPQYCDAEIIRTRDLSILKECDIVVDVGDVFDKSIHRYDHHQRGFTETIGSLLPFMKKYDIKLSSAGLIYTHFGEDIIRQKVNLKDAAAKIIFEKIYEHFIQEIDAIDNGIPICEGEPRYRISSNISSRVGRLNPEWNSSENIDVKSRFEEAMSLVGKEFLDRISYYANVWWPARAVVQLSVEKRFDVHSSGQIIELEMFVPWKQHFFDIEKELLSEETILYAIFEDSKGGWRVQCVSNTPESFVCRKFLRKDWWGNRDTMLSELSGIPGTVFCHATGFIGGNRTREGALQMAIKSLEAKDI